MREFFVENARFWLEEYPLRRLALDATQSILDASPRHVIAEIAAAVRRSAGAGRRRAYICAENEPQDARLVRPVEQGGYGCDALWNDDFHHTALVALTGRREAYLQDYLGSPQELCSALKWGYLFQGQHYYRQDKQRGQPALDVGAEHFVTYLQNHDQVANGISGRRLSSLAQPALLRALTSVWLLAPPTPMLFQGQEFGASTPFLYFADHEGELSSLVARGRAEFLSQFPSIDPKLGVELPAPHARSTFEACKLDFTEREKHAETYALHRELIALRHADPAFSSQRRLDAWSV